MSVQASTTSCPAGGLQGSSCYALNVVCPGLPNYTAYAKMVTPERPVGTIIFTTGGGSNHIYEEFKYGTQAVQEVVAAGFAAVELTYGTPFSNSQGWQYDAGGKGVRAASCRYAAIVQWVSSLHAGAPLCATGNSAGGQLIAEGLAHYNLGNHLKFAEITSGPPFNRVDWGCMDNVAPAVEYCSGANVGMSVGMDNAVAYVDPAYPGPWCSTSMPNHSNQHQVQFQTDSVTSPDAVLSYPNTKIRFLFGGLDVSTAIRQGLDYQSRIVQQTTYACIKDAPHTLPDVLDGAQAVAHDLITNCH